MSFRWDTSPEEVFPALAQSYADDIDAAVGRIARRYSGEIAAWMKANHAWQNQTGEAERLLDSEVIELTYAVVIAFGHGVEYGYFLEWANQGRFSVVSPALDYFGVKIWADIQRLFR